MISNDSRQVQTSHQAPKKTISKEYIYSFFLKYILVYCFVKYLSKSFTKIEFFKYNIVLDFI